jgi:hypothetical protein
VTFRGENVLVQRYNLLWGEQEVEVPLAQREKPAYFRVSDRKKLCIASSFKEFAEPTSWMPLNPDLVLQCLTRDSKI